MGPCVCVSVCVWERCTSLQGFKRFSVQSLLCRRTPIQVKETRWLGSSGDQRVRAGPKCTSRLADHAVGLFLALGGSSRVNCDLGLFRLRGRCRLDGGKCGVCSLRVHLVVVVLSCLVSDDLFGANEKVVSV